MQRKKSAGLPFLLLTVAALPALDRRPANRTACLAGLSDFTDSLKELSDLMQGIHSFLSGFSFISETIGFGTILLFLAVIVLSAGFSSLGMPRGKASFFSSLATADALWIFWKVSFNVPPSEYLFSMARANLIVLCPLAITAAVSWAAPSLRRRISSRISSLTGGKKSLGAREAADLFAECQERGARLNRAMAEDILAAGGGDVTLSGETRKSAEDLGETLARINRR